MTDSEAVDNDFDNLIATVSFSDGRPDMVCPLSEYHDWLIENCAELTAKGVSSNVVCK